MKHKITLELSTTDYNLLKDIADACKWPIEEVAMQCLKSGMPPSLSKVPAAFHDELLSLNALSDQALMQVADGKVPAPKEKSELYKKAKDASPEIIAEGKAIFEGKGTCVNCHGKKGDGNGPAGKVLNPGPRNFTNCKFHKKRKDGEMMWVIKNGSPGTGMVPLIPATISEEEGWKVIAYERSFCKK